MGDAASRFAVQALGDLIVQEVRLLGGVEYEVETLLNELRWLMAFLREADRVHEDERVRNCIGETNNIVNLTEDLVEFFVLKIIKSRRPRARPLESSFRDVTDCLKRWGCIVRECVFLCKARKQIEVIERDIKIIEKNIQVYGINQLMAQGPGGGGATDANSGGSARNRELLYTYSHEDDGNVVGLDNDIDDLVDRLVRVPEPDQSHHLHHVVFIRGMGGLGKTTGMEMSAGH